MRGKIGTAKDFAGLHKRIAILVTVGVVAAAGILVFLFVFWRGKSSKSEVNYREYTVSQGAVTVGTTETGTVALNSESVTFPIAVEVSEVLVKSGQTVKKGDPLVKLDLDSVADNSSETKEKLETAKSDLEQAAIDQESKLSAAKITYESSKYLAQSAPVARELTEENIQNGIESAQDALTKDQRDLAKYQALQKSWPADYAKLNELEKWMNDAKKAETSYETQLSNFNDTNSTVITQYNSLKSAKDQAYQNLLTAKYSGADSEGDDEDYCKDVYDAAKDALNDYSDAVAGTVMSQQSTLEDKVAQYTAEYQNYTDAYDDFKETYDETYDVTGTALDDKVKSLQSSVQTDQYDLKKAQGTAQISSYDAQVQEQTDLGTARTAQETYDLTVRKLAQAVETQQETYDKLQRQLDEINNAINGDGVIASPCDGIAAGISYSGGDSVEAGGTILSVYGDSSVSMSVSVSEDDIASVEVGQQASLSLSAYEGQTLSATVDSITAQPARSGSSSVTYLVVVKTSGDIDLPGKVYEGMSGEATLIRKSVPNVLYVSNRAITFNNGVSTVKVRDADGNIAAKTVGTGFSDGTNVEITSGLSEGDTVLAESAVTAA